MRERERKRRREEEWGSSCPVESIQRGGAEYNSLRGEEIQWCKSNTLHLIDTHTHTHTHSLSLTLSLNPFLLVLSPDISLYILPLFNFFLFLSRLLAHSVATLQPLPPTPPHTHIHTHTHTHWVAVCMQRDPEQREGLLSKAVHHDSSIFHQKQTVN